MINHITSHQSPKPPLHNPPSPLPSNLARWAEAETGAVGWVGLGWVGMKRWIMKLKGEKRIRLEIIIDDSIHPFIHSFLFAFAFAFFRPYANSKTRWEYLPTTLSTDLPTYLSNYATFFLSTYLVDRLKNQTPETGKKKSSRYARGIYIYPPTYVFLARYWDRWPHLLERGV